MKKMCSKVDGFDYLALSEPGPNKKFHRIGWIHFTENTDMKKTFQLLDNQKIDDFTFHLAMNRKNTPQTRVPRIAPDITNTTERLQKDYEQAKQLAVALEAVFDQHVDGLEVIEKRSQELIDQHAAEEGESDDKMEDGEEENTNEIWNLKKKLDLIIVYLRHVHMFCYYCGLECDSIEELNRKCCEPHCRKIANKAADEGVDPKQAAKIERGSK
jgi:hypothetical protein